MRKVCLSFLLAALAFSLFADDAIVMPKGVIRARVTNTYAFFDEAYDDDGKADSTDETKMDLLGGALELGMTDQLTLGLQWAPAASIWSDIDVDNAKLTGLDQLFVGVKALIVGEKGFVPSEKIRFAVSPGVRVPLQKYDGEEAMENSQNGKDFQVKSLDNEAFALGGRLALDYKINDAFFINLYSQIMYNLPVDRNPDVSNVVGLTETDDVIAAGGDVNQAMLDVAGKDYEHDYGLEYFFELDPQYDLAITEKSSVKFNLPLRYSYYPELKIEGETDNSDALVSTVYGVERYNVTLAPEVGFFSAEGLLPWHASVNYSIPLMGESDNKTNSVTLQVRLYARIFE